MLGTSTRAHAHHAGPRPAVEAGQVRLSTKLQHGRPGRPASLHTAANSMPEQQQAQAADASVLPPSSSTALQDTDRTAPAPAAAGQPAVSNTQQDWLQHDSTVIGARTSAAVLGSHPGIVWHMKRNHKPTNGYRGSSSSSISSSSSSSIAGGSQDGGWSVQYAAAAILNAMTPTEASSQPAAAAAGADAAGDAAHELPEEQQEQEQQQYWQALQQTQHTVLQQQHSHVQQQQQQDFSEPADFSLLERVSSHEAASTSGRDESWPVSSSSSSNSNNSSHTPADQQQQQQQRVLPPAMLDGGFESADKVLLWMQQGPAANFRDPRFEMAISRWIKEAPDWFKVRTVFERFSWRFNIVNLACTLSKLADLQEPTSTRRMLRTERAALRKFLLEALAAAAVLLPSVDVGTGAALLHSLSRLATGGKVTRCSQFVASLLEHMRPQLSSLKPNELVGCLWCLNRLQHCPPDDWMDDMFGQTQGVLAQLRAEEAAVLVRGLAGVRAQPPPQPWLLLLLSHVEGQMDQMEPKSLAMMLLGLANMQVRPNRSWMDAAMSALRSKFDVMGPQALSNVMWALSLMGCLPDRAWLSAYFNTTLLLLNSFNAKELAVDMWSLARLRLEPSDEWLDEYFDQTEAKLTGFTLRDLALCGYSLAKLGLRPPQTWLRRYCTLLLRFKAGLWHQKTLLTQVLVALDSFKVPRMDMWRRELYAAAGYKLYKFPNWRQRVKVVQAPVEPPYSSRRCFGRRGGLRADGNAAAAGAAGFRSAGGEGGLGGKVVPVALRSGDWGVMDGMGGGRGVLGSMGGSYEELGNITVSSSPTGVGSPSGSVGGSTVGGVNGSSSSRLAGDDSAAVSTSGSAWSSRDDSSSSISSMDAYGSGSATPGAAAAAGVAGSSAPAAAGLPPPPQGWNRSAPPRPLRATGLVRPPPPPSAAAAGGAPAGAAAAGAAGAQQPAGSNSGEANDIDASI